MSWLDDVIGEPEDFRAHLSEEQLERLERRQAPARRAGQPRTSLAAAVDRLAPGAGDDATTTATVGNDD